MCAEKKLFFIGWLCISQKSRSFSQPKHCLFEQAILLSSNDANFRNRHRKFAPSHNLLSTKERRCSFYLRPKSLRCNAGASHRFKAFSPLFCAKKRFRLVPPENFAKIFFGRALNRPRESRGSQPSACFCGTFCTPQKVPKNVPSQGAPRFCEPQFSSPQWRLCTNKIKTFPKEDSRFSKPRISAQT